MLFIELTDRMGKIRTDHSIGGIDKVGRESLNCPLIAPCSFIQIEIVCPINLGALERENVRAQTQLLGERPQEVSQCEYCLADGEFLLSILLSRILVIVVEYDLDLLGSQHLFQLDRLQKAH